MAVRIFPTSTALARRLATEIADGIAGADEAGRPFVLGCPGGRSPLDTYRELARIVAERNLPLDHVVIAMMDDYVVQTADGPEPVDEALLHSCRRFGRQEIVARLNRGALTPVRPEHLWGPDPRDPAEYEARLRDARVDLFLLASGASDGHVGFNPSGSAAESTTRVVELATSTRADNTVTFPHLATVDDVPTLGVSVGIATIREVADRAVMILTGPDKRRAASRILAATGYDPEWPATIVHDCAVGDVYVDAAAHGAPRREEG